MKRHRRKPDENINNPQGDLNADYAVRVNKFFTTYDKRPAPAVPGPDPAKPLFKGYQVT